MEDIASLAVYQGEYSPFSQFIPEKASILTSILFRAFFFSKKRDSKNLSTPLERSKRKSLPDLLIISVYSFEENSRGEIDYFLHDDVGV